MTIKQLLGGVFCLALSSSFAYSAETQPANRPIPHGMVLIPAGEFTMGSNKEENAAMWREANALNPYGFNDRLYVDEHPNHKVNLPDYFIDKYEVTNAQYLDFTVTTGHSVPVAWARNGYNYASDYLTYLSLDNLRQIASEKFNLDMDVTKMTQRALLKEIEKFQATRDPLPVTSVTWADADAFCRWSGKRLPSEAEWEKAARGPEGFEYPWGNHWDPKKINAMSEDPDAPYSAGGSFPSDKSPYGVYDMAGNVAEWVADWYEAYPGAEPSDIKFYGKKQRVVRGGMTSSGHYDSLSVVFRAARRTHLLPQTALIDVGFRCVKDIK